MYCPTCNQEIPANAKFCNECGAKIEHTGKTCPNVKCKRSGLPMEAVYCPNCGIELNPQKKAGEHLSSPITKETKLPGSLTNTNKNENRSNEVVWLDQKNGFFIDNRDNQKYMVVKIANQVWMAENLQFKINGCWMYDNKESNARRYGNLYDWKTAKKAAEGIKGWHIPNKDEWMSLFNYLSKDFSFWDLDGGQSKAFKALKEGGSSGFNALLGGYRWKDDYFQGLGYQSYFWSSTPNGEGEAYYFICSPKYPNATCLSHFCGSAFSVRLLKNL